MEEIFKAHLIEKSIPINVPSKNCKQFFEGPIDDTVNLNFFKTKILGNKKNSKKNDDKNITIKEAYKLVQESNSVLVNKLKNKLNLEFNKNKKIKLGIDLINNSIKIISYEEINNLEDYIFLFKYIYDKVSNLIKLENNNKEEFLNNTQGDVRFFVGASEERESVNPSNRGKTCAHHRMHVNRYSIRIKYIRKYILLYV